MPAVEHLLPLPGYESSSVVDINEAGLCVGKSFDPTQPTFSPTSRATLWTGLTPMHLRKVPPPGTAGLYQPSEAMRIDKNGRVLCKIHLPADLSSYYLWLSETEPAIDLSATFDDIEDVLDMNAEGLLLYTRKLGGLAIQDVGGGPRTELYLGHDPFFSPPEPIGIDNGGRVVVYWPPNVSFDPERTKVTYHLPSDPGTEWHELPEDNTFSPLLAKAGYVLLTDGGDDLGQAIYYDLREDPPPRKSIPRGENLSDHVSFYADASPDDWFVGGEGKGSDFTPTLYKKSNDEVTLLEYTYSHPDWHPSHAVGINKERIVGEGFTAVGDRRRAWRLALNGFTGPWPIPDLLHPPPTDLAIDRKAALLGATSHWYVLITKPDPAPFDVLQQLVADLKPEERRLVLSQVQEIGARFERLARMLREAGLGH